MASLVKPPLVDSLKINGTVCPEEHHDLPPFVKAPLGDHGGDLRWN